MGSSFCYPVEVCGFFGNDNCNVNDNGNGNGNGGETLGDSTVYGSSTTTTTATSKATTTTSARLKKYLEFGVLEGEVGNSFYGSRFGNPFC